MSDFLSPEEVGLMTDANIEESDYKSLKDAFKVCMDVIVETLSSIINENTVKYNEPIIKTKKASDIFSNSENILIKIELKTGIKGFSFLSLTEKNCRDIASFMMGNIDTTDLPIEDINSAICEAMNQMLGSACTALSRSVDNTIDISPPEIVNSKELNVEALFSGSIREDSNVVEINYPININDKISFDVVFVFTLISAKTTAFKAKTTESKNLLRLNPDLSRSIAEYFALLGSKYKAIYSMIGIIDNVSVLELNSIHSLQCLDVEVINNYNIINKNSQADLYNVYIYEKNFVEDMKNIAGLLDDEQSTWDILKELNNQFSYIFLEYCSDTNLVFNNVDCNNFLELPDNKYLLVTFNVGNYRFYQLLSFSLINKLKININKGDKPKVNLQTIESLKDETFDPKKAAIAVKEENGIVDIPKIYKKIEIKISAVLGEKEITIKDLLHISPGFIIHFNRKVTDNIDIFIDEFKKAEGEVGQLTYNRANNYAVKIKKFKKE